MKKIDKSIILSFDGLLGFVARGVLDYKSWMTIKHYPFQAMWNPNKIFHSSYHVHSSFFEPNVHRSGTRSLLFVSFLFVSQLLEILGHGPWSLVSASPLIKQARVEVLVLLNWWSVLTPDNLVVLVTLVCLVHLWIWGECIKSCFVNMVVYAKFHKLSGNSSTRITLRSAISLSYKGLGRCCHVPISQPFSWHSTCTQYAFSYYSRCQYCFVSWLKLIHHMKDNRPACCLRSLFAPFNTLCGTTRLYHTCPVSVSQESELYSILWQKILLEGPSGRDSFHTWDWGTPCYHTSVFRLASPTLETGDLAFCKMLTNSLD